MMVAVTDGFDPSCLFCRIAAGSELADIVLETNEVIAFLDVRPVFKGHVLVVPRFHVVTLPELPSDLYSPLLAATSRIAAAVVDGLAAQGSFIAMNNVVSQSVPHLHAHVIPRTKGDGLRGFFWPRLRYADGEAAGFAEKLRTSLASAS